MSNVSDNVTRRVQECGQKSSGNREKIGILGSASGFASTTVHVSHIHDLLIVDNPISSPHFASLPCIRYAMAASLTHSIRPLSIGLPSIEFDIA